MSITRRHLVLVLGAGLFGVSRSSFAQRQKIVRLGFLSSAGKRPFEAFTSGLRDLGYVEGKNVLIEWRFADGKSGELPRLAKELVELPANVIITHGTPAARAAQQATKSIPIVMLAVGDPVRSGLVASLSKPGGNLTGFSNVTSDTTFKRLELLHLVTPSASRLAVIWNPGNPNHEASVRKLQDTGKRTGVAISAFAVGTLGEIDRAFEAIARERASGVLLLADVFYAPHATHVGQLALKYRLPLIAHTIAIAEAGALMSYAADERAQHRGAAHYVDRILKGATPASLPVEQVSTFELVLNLKTADALGMTLPQELLLRADRLIK